MCHSHLTGGFAFQPLPAAFSLSGLQSPLIFAKGFVDSTSKARL